MCAKYSHGVWERFAHTFVNSDFPQKYAHVDTVFVYSYCEFKPLLVGLKQNATGKMTGPAMGPFHGFHEKVILTLYLPVRSMIVMRNLLSRLSV